MDRFPATACSFCDEWEEQISNPNQNEKRACLNEGRTIAPYGTKTQFRSHLGRHMEQLALFALPRNSLDDLDDESDREMTGDVGVDDSDASTESTVSERRGLIRAASAGSRNEELQVSKEFHDITKLELCFRCVSKPMTKAFVKFSQRTVPMQQDFPHINFQRPGLSIV